METKSYTYRESIDEAIGWHLSGQSLSQTLIDDAETKASKYYPGFHNIEVDSTTVAVEGEFFVVTFVWTA